MCTEWVLLKRIFKFIIIYSCKTCKVTYSTLVLVRRVNKVNKLPNILNELPKEPNRHTQKDREVKRDKGIHINIKERIKRERNRKINRYMI